jgi:hypothetical protein
MAKPSVSGLPQNIFVSAAAILVDGVDVGLVSGVKITLKEVTTPVHSDQFGKYVLNDFFVGHEATGECTFDEFNPSKMKLAFPQSALTNAGAVYKLSMGKQIGDDYLSIAKSFQIIPMNDDLTNKQRNYYFWKGVFTGESTIEWKPDGKLMLKAKMKFYIDASQPSGVQLGYMGDPAGGSIVHASLAAAVAGGGNVGNGTVSGLAASDLFTKTETWTLSCIHTVTNGGVFAVSGSVTGARGNATVGSAYTSNSITPGNSEISLTINDGAVDFALGDSFTIAATAANYV